MLTKVLKGAQKLSVFKKTVKYWQQELNLKHYDIIVTKEDLSELKDGEGSVSTACCSADHQNGVATISLTSEWPTHLVQCTNERVQKDAFHECCELFFWEIRIFLNKRYNWEVVDKMIHDKIRVLENILFRVV